jgi:RNA polymerase sigma-70 factor, ECF subfamily
VITKTERHERGDEVDSVDEYRWMFAAEYPTVVRTVYLVLHDYSRSEEIAQDAFVQLLRHWNKVRRYEAPGAWVRRVAIRLATRDAKREQRRIVLTRETIVQDRVEPSPITTIDPELTAAIKSLPAQQRAVVVLFYFEDRPMEEIAEIAGCSVSTGWVHLHRARKRLGTLLSEEVTNDVH